MYINVFLFLVILIITKKEGYQSGQMGRAVNPLAPAFEGSNPSPSTIKMLNLLIIFHFSKC